MCHHSATTKISSSADGDAHVRLVALNGSMHACHSVSCDSSDANLAHALEPHSLPRAQQQAPLPRHVHQALQLPQGQRAAQAGRRRGQRHLQVARLACTRGTRHVAQHMRYRSSKHCTVYGPSPVPPLTRPPTPPHRLAPPPGTETPIRLLPSPAASPPRTPYLLSTLHALRQGPDHHCYTHPPAPCLLIQLACTCLRPYCLHPAPHPLPTRQSPAHPLGRRHDGHQPVARRVERNAPMGASNLHRHILTIVSWLVIRRTPRHSQWRCNVGVTGGHRPQGMCSTVTAAAPTKSGTWGSHVSAEAAVCHAHRCGGSNAHL